MSRLLYAGFARLRKDPLFWVGMFIMILLDIFLIGITWRTRIADSVEGNLDEVLFGYMSGIGFVCAVFCSFFSGREYREGTIRNKLIAGYTKVEVYLSNLILNVMSSLCICVLSFVIETILGFLLLGRIQMGLGTVVTILFGSFLTVIAFCSIFTMIAMLDQSKVVGDIACIGLVCVFLLSAMYLMGALIDIEQYEVTLGTAEEIEGYGEITQEEYQKYITEISGLPEGEYGDYFSYEDIHEQEQMVLKRNVYEFLYDVLPYGQAMQYVSKDVKHPGRLWMYSLWWILVTTSFGVLVFRKKNIR